MIGGLICILVAKIVLDRWPSKCYNGHKGSEPLVE